MSFSKINGAGWGAGAVLTHTQLNALDTDHANAVDKTGDTVPGGATITFADTSTLSMASGATHTFTSGSTLGVASGAVANVASGGTFSISSGATASCATTLTITGANGKLQTASSGRIILGDNDYPQFSATRTITRVHMLSEYPLLTASGFTTSHLGATATGLGGSLGLAVLDLVDGSTLTSVEAIFIPVGGHVGQPANLPQIGVYRRLLNAGASWSGSIADLGSTAVQLFTWVSLSSYNNGNEHSLLFTANQNNVIDRSQYVYYLFIDDEAGANALAGNEYVGIKYTYTIADMRTR